MAGSAPLGYGGSAGCGGDGAWVLVERMVRGESAEGGTWGLPGVGVGSVGVGGGC